MNRFKRFLSLMVTVLMIVNMLPMQALAETTNWRGTGASTYASVNGNEITIQVGEKHTIDGKKGESKRADYHQWSVSPSNGGLKLTHSGDRYQNYTVIGVTPGTYIVTHYYYDDKEWKKQTFTVTVLSDQLTITFDANGGSGTVPSPITVENSGDAVLLPNGDGLYKNGCTFMGWVLSSGAGMANSSDKTIYPANSRYSVTKSVTLYALWGESADAYYFVRLDGTIPTEPGSYSASAYTDQSDSMKGTVKYNTFYARTDGDGVASHLGTIPSTTAIREACNEKAGTVKFSDGTSYQECKTDEEFNLKYYVLWYVIKQNPIHVDGVLLRRDLYNVSYDPNATDYTGDVPLGKQYPAGATVTVENAVLQRPGFTFGGWRYESTDTIYHGGETFTMPDNDVVLKAVWTANTTGALVINKTLYGAAEETFQFEIKKGEDVIQTVTFHYDASHHIASVNLPAGDYTVSEVAKGGYTNLSGNDLPVKVVAGGTATVSFVNTTNTSFTATKQWKDDNNTEKKRPTSIQAQLYQNGTPHGDPVSIAAADNWTYTWNNLPKYGVDGDECVYTVKEVSVPEDYASSVENSIITNTLTGTANVTVTKTWADEGNQDGKRPAAADFSVTLTNGDNIYTASNWAGDGDVWTATIENVPLYDFDGKKITYNVAESEVVGYTPDGANPATIIPADGAALALTNTHTPETISVTVKKVWVDGNNSANTRPEAITIELNGNEYVMKNGETEHTFENLPKYANGVKIVYTAHEVGEADGKIAGVNGAEYAVSYSDDRLTITNTIVDPENVTVTGTKTWVDGGKNHDNAKEITLTLSRTSSKAGSEKKTVNNAAFKWEGDTYKFTDLPKYDAEGYEYTYTVAETPIDGYTTKQVGYNFTNTMSDIDAEIIVTGTKTWADGGKPHDNADQVKLTLKRTSAKPNAAEETVNATVSWDGNKYTYSNLRKYDTEGYLYTYTVVEEKVEGYNDPVYSGFDIINTMSTINDKTEVTGTKTWVDGGKSHNNAKEITLTLSRTSSKRDAATEIVTGATFAWEGNTYKFTDLPKYDAEGYEYTYTVAETPILGYTTKQVGYNFTNTMSTINDTTEVSGIKTWADEGNHNNADQVKLTLSRKSAKAGAADETVTNPTFAWEGNTYTFSNLPKYDAEGYEYIYTVAETTIDGYITTQDGYDFTNTPDTKVITVTKTWDDDSNRDGVRPAKDAFTVTLTGGVADVAITGDQWTVEGNVWTAKVAVRTHDYTGKAITYTATESSVNGYTLNATDRTATPSTNDVEIALTNTHTIDKVTVTAKKVWEDNDNEDGIRPSVQFQLYANGVEFGEPLTPNADNNWNVSWTGLNENEAGKAIDYTVKEIGEENNAIASLDPNRSYKVAYANEGYKWTITNSYEPQKVTISGTKTWVGLKDGETAPEAIVTLQYLDSDADEWKQAAAAQTVNGAYTFTEPKFSKGSTVARKYRVVESKTGYTTTYSSADGVATFENDAATINITNTANTVNGITVTKTWNDLSDRYGLRPSDLTVKLDGGDVTYTVSGEQWTKSGNVWTATIDDVRTYDVNGAPITYTVTEDGVPSTYTAAPSNTKEIIPANKQNAVALTNALNTKTVTITKTVVDASGETTARAFEIGYTVAMDGMTAYTGKVELADGKSEPLTVPAGAAVTANEEPGNGWTASITGNETDAITVTNTRDVATKLTVTKTWITAPGVATPNLTVTIGRKIGNGEPDKTYPVKLTSANWSADLSNLPTHDQNGKEYTYYIVSETATYEADADALKLYTGDTSATTTLTKGEAASLTLTNELNQDESVSVSVRKAWVDNTENHPSVTLVLNGDGVSVQTFELTNETGWEDTFTDLPKYADVMTDGVLTGKREIVYSVSEPTVPAGYTLGGIEKVDSVFVVTNVIKAGERTITVNKTWDVPNYVSDTTTAATFTLYRDGEAYGETITLTKGDAVSGSWEKLPVNNTVTGKPYVYTVQETCDNPNYTVETGAKPVGEDDKVSFTNRMKYGSLTVAKATEGLLDGEDPEFSFTITRDGNKVETFTLKSGDTKTITVPVGEYIVTETSNGAWTADKNNVRTTVARDGNAKVTITNTRNLSETDYTVVKNWVGDERYTFARPALTYNLYGKVGEQWITSTGALSDTKIAYDTKRVTSEPYGANFGKLPTHTADGKLITWSVEESMADNGFTYTSESKTEGTKTTFTNTLETMNVTVTKTWNDNGIVLTETPTLTLGLYYGDQWVAEAKGTTTFTFTGVPARESGYTVSEEKIEGGKVLNNGTEQPAYTLFAANQTAIVGEDGHASLTNTASMRAIKVSKTIDLNGTEWTAATYPTFNFKVDWVSADGAHPIELSLTPEMGEDGSTITATSGQILVPANQEIKVTETPVDGWTADNAEKSVPAGNTLETVSFTNTRVKAKLVVTKNWDDMDGAAAERPEVTFQLLYSDGTPVQKDSAGWTITLPASDATRATVTFKGVPYNANGYKVKEIMGGENTGKYTVVNDTNDVEWNENGMTTSFTNTRTMAVVTVTKKISDSTIDSAEGMSSKFKFSIDGGTTMSNAIGDGESVTFNVTIGKEYTLTEYDENGDALPAGVWTTTGLGEFTARDAEESIIVTNTRTNTTLSGAKKVWVGETPENHNITVEIGRKTANSAVESVGEVTVTNADGEFTISAIGGKQLSATDLNGNAYTYSIIGETPVDGYTTVIENDAITNTQNATLTIRKVVEGESDQSFSFAVDGERFELKSGGEKILTVTGEKTYTVTETQQRGYYLKSVTVDGTEQETANLSNELKLTAGANMTIVYTNAPQTGSFTITKTGADGALAGVEFKLYQGEDEVATVITDAEGHATFSGIVIGEYELRETQTADGYVLDETPRKVTVSGNNTNTAAATVVVEGGETWVNHLNDQTSFTLTKGVVDDATDSYTGKFNFTVTLVNTTHKNYTVKVNNTEFPATDGTVTFDHNVLLGKGEHWTVTGMPHGTTITVTENLTNDQKRVWTSNQTNDQATATITAEAPNATINFTNTRNRASLTANKVWNDQENRYGYRTGSYAFQLYRKVEGGEAVAVGEAKTASVDVESITWNDLAQYDAAGNAYIYYVAETDGPAGYDKAAPSAEVKLTEGDQTVSITNSLSVMNVTVTKVWNDHGWTVAHPKISFTLSDTDTEKKFAPQDATLVDDRVVFENVPVSTTYKVEEIIGETPYTYAKAIDKRADGAFTVTNTLQLMDVTVTKTWNDNGIIGAKHPTPTFELRVGDDTIATATKVEGKDDTYEFTGVPYRKGYTVVETELDDKTSYSVNSTAAAVTLDKDQNGTATIANTNKFGVLTITKKVNLNGTEWVGDAPTFTFDYSYVSNGGTVEDSITLTTLGETTTGQITLPVGAVVTVTEREDSAWTTQSEDSASVLIGAEPVNVTFTNTRVKTDLAVTKNWNDMGGDVEERPEVSFKLLYNDEQSTPVQKGGKDWTITLPASAATSATATFEGVPYNADGYKVKEIMGENTGEYVVDSAIKTVAWNADGMEAEFTNTRTMAVVTVTKKIVDETTDSENGLNSQFTFSIGDEMSKAIGDGESVTFNVKIGEKYTLTEYDADGKALPENVWTTLGLGEFTATTAALGITVTNTRIPTSVGFTKVWVDNGNADNTRPATITVVPEVQNGDIWTEVGNAIPATLNVNETTQRYTGLFANLPAKALDGTDYVYRVVEAADPTGYTSSEANGTVTNGLNAGDTSISITKNWVDASNAQNTRPDAETYKSWLTLYRKSATEQDWTAIDSYTLSVSASGNSYAVAYSDLPKYDTEDGAKYTYAVAETIPADSEYVLSYPNDQQYAFDGDTITNTLSATTNVTVTKVWNDGDGALDEALIPATELTIRLTRLDDADFSATETVNKTNRAVTFTVDKYDADGKLYIYQASEDRAVNNVITIGKIKYDVAVSGGNYAFTITNTRQNDGETLPEKTATAPTVSYENDGAMVKPGDKITYTIAWHNHFNVPKSIVITDALDEHLEFVGASNDGTETNGTVTWNLGEQPAFASGTVTVTVKVKALASDEVNDPKATNEAKVVIDNKIEQPSNPVETTIAHPRLKVEKDITNRSDKLYERDEVIAYSVTVTNTGNLTLSNVELTDARILDVNAVTADGTFNIVDGRIVIPTMAPGDSITFTYGYTVTSADILAGKVDNTATATAADPTTEDGTITASDTESTTLNGIDVTLEVAKTSDVDDPDTKDVRETAHLNQEINYTIKVTNKGNVPMSHVVVEDTLKGAKIQSDVNYDYAVVEGKAVIDTLGVGKFVEVYATYKVTSNDILAGEITNTVNVTGDPIKDPDPTKPDHVPSGSAQCTDPTDKIDTTLVVEKTSDVKADAVVKSGDKITYTITVRNDGNVPYHNVKVTDELAGLTITDVDGEKVSDNTVTIDELAVGQTVTITATYTVTADDVASGHVYNHVTAEGDDPKPDDPDPEKPKGDDDVDVPTMPTKSVDVGDGTAVKVNQQLTYTISYYNHFKTPATVTITDVLDEGLKIVKLNGATYDSATRTLTWRINAPASQQGTVSVDVRVIEEAKRQVEGEEVAQVENEATVNVGGVISTTNKVINPLAGETADEHKPEKTSDVPEGGTVKVGEQITYTIDYFNYNNFKANVVITDTLDPGVEFVPTDFSMAGATREYNEATRTVTWRINDVTALTGGSVTLTVEVIKTAKETVDGEELATVNNTAGVTIGNAATVEAKADDIPVTPDPEEVPTKNVVAGPDADGVVGIGDEIVYDIVYYNFDNRPAEVRITDTLDPGVKLVEAVGATYDEASRTLTWNIGTVKPFTGGSVRLTVEVTDEAKKTNDGEKIATVENTAGVTIGANHYPEVKATPIPVRPDPEEGNEPTKTVTSGPDENGTIQVGDKITYEIEYYNYNNVPADIEITDPLDPGVKFDSATGGATYDEANRIVTWKFASVKPFTKGSVTLTVEVTDEAKKTDDEEAQATVKNAAGVTIGNKSYVDVKPEEDIPVKPDDPRDPTKTVTSELGENDTVDVGDEITYEIAYYNNDNVPVTVTITDPLDEGVEFVETEFSMEGATRTYNAETRTVTWEITNVRPFTEGSVTLTVVVTENAKTTGDGEAIATVDNTAGVTIGNNAYPEVKADPIPVKPEDPKTPEKTYDPQVETEFGMAKVGDEITYTIAYRNHRNIPATVVITDPLDDGVDFVETEFSMAGATRTYNAENHTVTWTIENVKPFTDGSVELVVRVNESAIDGQYPTVDNTATCKVDNEPETSLETPVVIPVHHPALQIEKTIVETRAAEEQKDYYAVGETVSYDLTVTNIGNLTLNNVEVSDEIDALEGRATLVAGEGYEIVNGVAVIDELAPEATVTVRAEYVVLLSDLDAGEIMNHASVKAPDPTDPNEDVPAEDEVPFTPDTSVEVYGTKIWNDLDNLYGVRPETITVRLFADGEELDAQTVAAAEDGTWQYQFTALPAHHADGTPVVYTVAEDAVDGYDTTLIPVDGEADAEGEIRTNHWDIQNDLQQYSLTVRYWFGFVGGTPAATTFNRTYYYGQPYNVTSPRITGYAASANAVSGIITGDAEYDVIYTPVDYNLTVYYVYEDGTTAAATYTGTMNINDAYDVASPVLEGYVASRMAVSGTMPAYNMVYTVIYVPETELVELDEYGVPLNIGSVVMNVGDCFE